MWTTMLRTGLTGLCRLLFFLGACQRGYTQVLPPHWDQLSQPEGLSQSYVTCMLQDRLGFMWFGTADGLNRYDGLQFKTWFHRASDSTSLSHNLIDALVEDRRGTLWVGTHDGLSGYHPTSDTFERFSHRPNDPTSLAHNKIWALLADRQGFLWIGTRDGLDRFDPVHRRFVHYPFRERNPNGISHPQIRSLYQDRQGMIWIGTFGGGLNRYDPRTNRFTVYRHEPTNPQSLSHDTVTSLYEDRQGRFWVGTYGGGLNLMDRARGTFRAFRHQLGNPGSLSHDAIYALLEDRQGQFWVGTDGGGLNRFDRTTEVFVRYLSTPLGRHTLSSPVVKTLLQDRQQNLWVGTWQGGINVRYAARQPFRVYKANAYATGGGRNEFVAGFLDDKAGNVWIDLDGTGLSRFDPLTNRFTYFPRVAPAGHAPFKAITAIQAKIWAVTHTNPWPQWGDPKPGFLPPCQPGNDTLRHQIINQLFIDEQKNWWLVAAGGVLRFDHRRRCYQTFHQEPGRPGSLSAGSPSTLFEDRQHRIWLGVAGGIDRFDSITQRFDHYLFNARAHYGEAVGIGQDSQGMLWVVSQAGDLFRLDPRPGQRAGLQHRLSLGHSAMGLVIDARDRLWVTTRQGLFRYDPGSSALRHYDRQDGLPSDEFLPTSLLKARSGLLYAGGISGFTVFDPLRIRDNPYLPPVVLTDFRLAGRTRPSRADTLRPPSPLPPAIAYVNRLELAHDQNDFSVAFAALNYYQARKNRFRYRLLGYDAYWQETDGTHPLATYTNIDPGRYTFEVQAANNDGIWNPASRLLVLLIRRPWWASYWAYGVYGLLVLGIGYQSLRWYRHRLRVDQLARQRAYRAQQERELSAVKSRFFENMTHEFRTPLTLILTPTQQLKEQLHDPAQAAQNDRRLATIDRSAHQLLSLVNQLLDLSKLEAKTLPVTESVGDPALVVGAIVAAFQTQAEARSIQLTFEAAPLAPAWWFDPAILERIVVNLLANALKFTDAGGLVSVTLTPVATGVQLTLTDTGAGIAPDELPRIFERFYQATTARPGPARPTPLIPPIPQPSGTGIGLALVHELVELQQGQIAVTSQVGQGTTFTVGLPYRPVQLPPVPNKVAEPVPAPGVTEEAPRVLVVEDNEELRQLIAESFPAHYTVLQATDGQDGFRQATEQQPDLIISDVLMPLMDGYTLVRQVKNDWRTSHIPVLLLTAKSASASRLAGLSAGADDYLSKPFQIDELQWRVHNRLEQQRQQRSWLKAHLTQPASASSGVTTPALDSFLTSVYELLEHHLDDTTFGPEALAAALGQSRMSVYRKLKALTGLSASECIRGYRLKRACVYLQQRVPVAETAYRVGFDSPAYFTKCFREAYQQTPSEFARSTTLP